MSSYLTNAAKVMLIHSQITCSAHFKVVSYFQHTCGHSSNLTQSVDSTHRWLRRLGVSRVLLLLGCRRGGGIGSLGLGCGWAAV